MGEGECLGDIESVFKLNSLFTAICLSDNVKYFTLQKEYYL